MNNNAINTDFVQITPLQSESSFSELKQIIFRRWKPALAVGTMAFVGFFVPLILQTPIYSSETLILLDNPKTQKSATIAPNSMDELSNSYLNLKSFSTEILILKSKSLIAKAMKKYPDTFQDLPIELVTKNLQINQAAVTDMPTNILSVSYFDSEPQRAKKVLEALGSIYIEYSLERQRSQAANAIKFIDEQLPDSQLELDVVAYELRSFRQENNIVDPNTYASGTSEFRQTLEKQSNAIEINLAKAKSQQEEISFQLKALGQNPETIVASTILSQDGIYQNLASQLSELETQYLLGSTNFKDTYPVMQELKDKRKELQASLKARAKQVLGNTVSQTILDQAIINSTDTIANNDSAASDQGIINSTDTIANPDSAAPNQGIINSTNTIADTDSANTSSTPTDNSKVQSQGGILVNLGNQLLEVQNEIAILESQIDSTDKAKAKVEKNFQNLPRLQQTYAELERQLEVKSESVSYLLKRRQELQIALAEETAPWQVLEKPYLPIKPISPNIQKGLILALVAGGFFGIVAAWVLQQLDNRVKLVDEAKQITQLPLIGAIPRVSEPRIVLSTETTAKPTKSYNYYYSSFTEAFRTIAMNLSYVMVKSGKIKSLVLTSSTSSEGKTTSTYNLALALADLGSRVLVIDADLRKPKIHKVSQLSNKKGLSEAITTDEPWSEIIKTNIVANLDIMTSGTNVPNPIALLQSQKMIQLLREWEAAYDYVIFDTPPIGVMADAQSLIHHVDTVLLVAGIDRATQKSLSHTVEMLRSTNCNLAGFVANFVEQNLDYYSYSYYSHYYNQSNRQSNSSELSSEGRINDIMQQFRRR